MVRLFVNHRVADYTIWKRGYDEAEGLRQQSGVTMASVFRDASDPSIVIVTHDFANLAAAQAFAGNPGLKDAMTQAGVVGKPTFWFGEEQ